MIEKATGKNTTLKTKELEESSWTDLYNSCLQLALIVLESAVQPVKTEKQSVVLASCKVHETQRLWKDIPKCNSNT